jgi:hypothetical protein
MTTQDDSERLLRMSLDIPGKDLRQAVSRLAFSD